MHLDGFVGEAALIQVVAHSLQQVDVDHLQVAVLFVQETFEKAQVLAYLQLRFRGIVEDPETDLVAKPLTLQKLFGEDLFRDLVEPIL